MRWCGRWLMPSRSWLRLSGSRRGRAGTGTTTRLSLLETNVGPRPIVLPHGHLVYWNRSRTLSLCIGLVPYSHGPSLPNLSFSRSLHSVLSLAPHISFLAFFQFCSALLPVLFCCMDNASFLLTRVQPSGGLTSPTRASISLRRAPSHGHVLPSAHHGPRTSFVPPSAPMPPSNPPTNPSSPSPTPVSPSESSFFPSLFTKFQESGSITGASAFNLLPLSDVPLPILGEIWGIADPDDKGSLDVAGWTVAMRLISVAQRGGEVSKEAGEQGQSLSFVISRVVHGIWEMDRGKSSWLEEDGHGAFRRISG